VEKVYQSEDYQFGVNHFEKYHNLVSLTEIEEKKRIPRRRK
jgi:hypothetical protein